MSVKPNFGGKDLPLVFKGDKLIYPNPVKDGLVLWYDFSGRTNTDGQRGIAEDLSGNGNHGTLQNFNYTAESGYDKNKLLFDGVDDYVQAKSIENIREYMSINKNFSLEFTFTPYGLNGALFGLLDANADRHGAYFHDGLLTCGYLHPLNGWVGFRSSKEVLSGETYVVVIKNVDEKIFIYFNGVEDTIDGAPIYMNTTSFALGYSTGSMGHSGTSSRLPRYFDGNMHSFKIYNRPLTPEEIAHNYAIEKERFGITDNVSLPIGKAIIGKTNKVGGDR